MPEKSASDKEFREEIGKAASGYSVASAMAAALIGYSLGNKLRGKRRKPTK